MRPFQFDIDLANSVAAGLASGNSSAGATVTLDGSLTSGGTFTSADGFGRRIIITDTGADDQTGATYTLTGTDSDGIAQTEDIAGPGASASVTTTKYFLTVTSIAIASPVAGSTVDIGTVDEAATQTLPLNYRDVNGPTYAVDVTGTINYTVNETLDKIHTLTNPSAAAWFALSALSAKTADLMSTGTPNATACQLIVNSFTDTAEIQFTVMQNESI